MEAAAGILTQEPVLPIGIVCRNLWNFYSLDYYDESLFNKFCGVIRKEAKHLGELDVANAFIALSGF